MTRCKVALIVLMSYLFTASICAQNEINIVLKPTDLKMEAISEGFFLNGLIIDSLTKVSEVFEVIGEPSCTHFPDSMKISEYIREYHFPPDIIHTFDELGINISQNLNNDRVSSIMIHFDRTKFDYSPQSKFKGKFVINKTTLWRGLKTYSLFDIPGLEVDRIISSISMAHFKSTEFVFFFKDDLVDSRMKIITVMVSNIPPGPKTSMWSTAEIQDLMMEMKSDSMFMQHLLAESEKYHYDAEDFIEVYALTIASFFNPEEVKDPSLETQAKIHQILDYCSKLFIQDAAK